MPPVHYPSIDSPFDGGEPLHPFVAELEPAALHRLGETEVTVRATECSVEPYPGLGPIPAWGTGLVDGPVHSPGVGLEATAGVESQIYFRNDLQRMELPFDVAVVPSPGRTADHEGAEGYEEPDSAQNHLGTGGFATQTPTGLPIGWLVSHLHGAHALPENDGWTDHMRPPGMGHHCRFANDDDNADLDLRKVGPALWYHDHAMNATRFHVYAGLAAPYVIRHPREAALGLPTTPDDGEVVLMIQDRNLHVVADGTVRMLHKTTTGTSEFFGPLTLVNGLLWPRLRAGHDVVRLRIYSASNARFLRLHLLDENGDSLHQRVLVIGTDGGLLWRAHRLGSDEPITLAPAERIDLLVDLRGLAGQRLVWVNSADAPFSGDAVDEHHRDVTEPNRNQRVPFPQVMCIDVDGTVGADASDANLWDALAGGVELNPDHRRLGLDETSPTPNEPLGLQIPPDAVRRLIVLSESNPPGMLLQTEVAEDDDGPIEIQLPGQDAPRSYRAIGAEFYDTVGIFPVVGEWEVWQFLNTTGDTHPMHVHQSFFQPLGDRADAMHAHARYDQVSRTTTQPIVPDDERVGRSYDTHERWGWNDTVRVDPGELVSIAVRFDLAGRYVYHCHMIEHEDNAMMRPFIVVPVAMNMAM